MILDGRSDPWIAVSNGIERYDRKSDRFVHVARFAARTRFRRWHSMVPRSLWLHRLGALEHYDLKDGESDCCGAIRQSAHGWPAMQVSDLHVAADHAIWAASPRGLWRFDAKSHAHSPVQRA